MTPLIADLQLSSVFIILKLTWGFRFHLFLSTVHVTHAINSPAELRARRSVDRQPKADLQPELPAQLDDLHDRPAFTQFVRACRAAD